MLLISNLKIYIFALYFKLKKEFFKENLKFQLEMMDNKGNEIIRNKRERIFFLICNKCIDE